MKFLAMQGLSLFPAINALIKLKAMIQSLTLLLAFQALGELLSVIWLQAIPGPVIGLCLLLAFLFVKGGVPADLKQTSLAFTGNLGLLFVPAAVGVVVFWPLLAEYGWIILVSLTVSVVVVLGVTSVLLDRLAASWVDAPAKAKEDNEVL